MSAAPKLPSARSDLFERSSTSSAKPLPPFLSSSRSAGGRAVAEGQQHQDFTANNGNKKDTTPPFLTSGRRRLGSSCSVGGSAAPPYGGGPTDGARYTSQPYTERSSTARSLPAAEQEHGVLPQTNRSSVDSRYSNQGEDTEHAFVDITPEDDMLELEHMIGCGCGHLNTLAIHPTDPNVTVRAVGSALVIGDLTDPHNETFLRGHDMDISALSLSCTGEVAATGQSGSRHVKGFPSTVIVWDIASVEKRKLMVLEGITHGVRRLAFSPDQRFLMGSGNDTVLFIWDMQTSEAVYAKNMPAPLQFWQWGIVDTTGRRPVYEVYTCWKDDVMVMELSFDPIRRQWQLVGNAMAMPSTGLNRTYNSCALTADGDYLVNASAVGDMIVFSTVNKVYRASIPCCSGGLLTIVVEKSSGAIFCGGGDATIRKMIGNDFQWQVEDQIKLDGKIMSLSLSELSRELLVVTSNGSCYRFPTNNLSSAQLVSRSHIAPVTAVACGGGGGGGVGASRNDVFATAAADGSVKVWNLSDYSVTAEATWANGGTANKRTKSVQSLASTTTNVNASGGGSGSGGVGGSHHRASSSSSSSLSANDGSAKIEKSGCLCLCWVEDRAIITGWADHSIRLSDAASGKQIWEIPNAHREAVTSVAVHTGANLAYLVSGGDDGCVRVWALRTREMMVQFAEHHSGVSTVCVDVTAPHLIHSAGKDCAVFTYDLRKERRTVAHLTTKTGQITCMTQRIDSEQELITCDTSGRLLYWDCDIRDPVQILQDPSRKRLRCVQVSPTGRFLVACGDDALIRVIDLKDGSTVAAGRGHSGPATGLHWSADERQIISVGEDCTICIWNFYAPDPEL